MSETHSNSATPALHSLSQISFRLSQRPPSGKRASRRQLDRVDSIEDSNLSDYIAIGMPPSQATATENGTGRHKAATERRATASIVDCIAPPTLSSPILSFSSTALLQSAATPDLLSTPSHQRDAVARHGLPERMPLSHICNKATTALSAAHSFQYSPSPTDRRGIFELQPRKHTLTSPLRSISVHRQSISQQSLLVNRRSLLSQRPNLTHSSCAATHGSDLITQRAYIAAIQPEDMQQRPCLVPSLKTPSKRPRNEGTAVAEFRRVIASEASEFCMWWHCLSGGSGTSRVCHQPQIGLRLRVYNLSCVVQPHLFCLQTEIVEVGTPSTSSAPQLLAGQSLTTLLSIAVCMDALPWVAKRIADRFVVLESNTNDLTASQHSTEGSLLVSVYEPWRIQGEGEQLCLFASWFHIE
ncbi:hypothetical protein BX070DRAFT_254157 [Coemansia spiralis]|nr:hypothetical protein BX070DRAFT_254157 [Coemansia spiralis]